MFEKKSSEEISKLESASSTETSNNETSGNNISSGSESLSDIDSNNIEKLEQALEKAWDKYDFGKANVFEDKIITLLDGQYQKGIKHGNYDEAVKIRKKLKDDYDIDLKDDDSLPSNTAPIHMAIIDGNLKAVEAIVKKNVSQLFAIMDDSDSEPDSELDTDTIPNEPLNPYPIHLAAYDGYSKILRILLVVVKQVFGEKFEKYLNVRDAYNRSAIYFAAVRRHIEAIDVLLSYLEVDIYIDKERGSLYHLAIENNDKILLKKLLAFDIRRHKVLENKTERYSAYNQTLATHLHIINYQNKSGKTAFHYACINKDIEAAKILLNHPFININIEDNKGLTPINYLIKNSSIKILEKVREKVLANKKVYQSGRKRIFHKSKKIILDQDLIANNYESENDIEDKLRDFLDETVAGNVAASMMENDSFESEDDEHEGLTYIHAALETNDWQVLLQVLHFVELDLEIPENQHERRVITSAKDNLKEKLTRNKRDALKQIHNVISTNIRHKNLTGLKKELARYATEDLEKIHLLATTTLRETPLLEGYNNFNEQIPINKKEKDPSYRIKNEHVITIIKDILEERKKEDINTKEAVINEEAFNYILLQAAHSIFEEENYTSGEELDSDIETEMSNLRTQQWENALSNNENNTSEESEAFVPIFRGINFISDKFEYEDRTEYEKKAYNKTFFASHTCYLLAGREIYDQHVPQELLEEKAEQIKKLIKELDDPNTMELFKGSKKAVRHCKTLLRRLQVLYTENISGFNFEVFANISGASKKLKERIIKKFPWFEHIFAANPFVSGSILPMHSVRYAIGVSRAAANTGLIFGPQYGENGIPKYPCVGMVFIALYPKKEYQALDAINIPKAFAQGEFLLKEYWKLLPEAEITIVGMMKHVVIGLPILYPSFAEKDREEVIKKYNFSSKTYQEIAVGLKQKRRSESYRRAIDKLRKFLIKYYDNKLMEVAKHHAQLKDGHLVFELPNGEFATIAPTPHEIHKIAEELSPLVKRGVKRKAEDKPNNTNKKIKSPTKTMEEIEANQTTKEGKREIASNSNPSQKSAEQLSKSKRENSLNFSSYQKILREFNDESGYLSDDEIGLFREENEVDEANLNSYRSVNAIEEEGITKPCIVVPAVPDGNCGFTSIRQGLILQDYENLAENFYRNNFIRFIEDIINNTEQYVKYKNYILQIFENDKARNFNEWKDKFKSSNYWMEEAHFYFISHYYNLKFNFYYIPSDERKNAYELEPGYEKIYEGSDVSSATTLNLAHVKTGLNSQLNHFDTIIIEPTENQIKRAVAIRSNNNTNAISGKHAYISDSNLQKNFSSRNNKMNLNRKGLKKVSDIVLKELKLPTKLELGAAIDNGDCFFDSIAQAMNINRNKKINVKSLRMICHKFYIDNIQQVNELNENDTNGIDKAGDYYFVQYTQDELTKMKQEKLLNAYGIWGRPEIEGMMICREFNIKLHVVGILANGKKMEFVIDKDGQKPMPVINTAEFYSDPNIVHLVQKDNHFVPILPKQLINNEEYDRPLQEIEYHTTENKFK